MRIQILNGNLVLLAARQNNFIDKKRRRSRSLAAL
jgi:hypothetical protein